MTRPLPLALLLAALVLPACADETEPVLDAAAPGDGGTQIICPDGVDNYINPFTCSVKGQHCVTATGAYPYGADCIGCEPPYHWETDQVRPRCDDGGAP